MVNHVLFVFVDITNRIQTAIDTTEMYWLIFVKSRWFIAPRGRGPYMIVVSIPIQSGSLDVTPEIFT